MKTFTRNRTLKELRAAVKANGWGRVNARRYNQGWDSVSFNFQVGSVRGRCIYNTFNGRFIVVLKGQPDDLITEESTEYERKRWYQKLLNTLYIP